MENIPKAVEEEIMEKVSKTEEKETSKTGAVLKSKPGFWEKTKTFFTSEVSREKALEIIESHPVKKQMYNELLNTGDTVKAEKYVQFVEKNPHIKYRVNWNEEKQEFEEPTDISGPVSREKALKIIESHPIKRQMYNELLTSSNIDAKVKAEKYVQFIEKNPNIKSIGWNEEKQKFESTGIMEQAGDILGARTYK